MSDSTLDKLLGLKKGAAKGETPKQEAPPSMLPDDEPEKDFEVYGSDRTRKPKMMLSFRRDKAVKHIPYPHILMMDEEEGRLITIYTTACTITVQGDKLENIAYRIKRGDLSYIQEGKAVAPDGSRVDRIAYDLG